VAGIAAIHHPLGKINSRPDHIRLIVHVGPPIDRPAVNAHPQLDVRKTLQRLADLQRAAHRLFWATEKNQRHAIPHR